MSGVLFVVWVGRFTPMSGSLLELGMSENKIRPVTEPGRTRPYITIVDTGVAMAAHLFVGMLELWVDESIAEGMTLEEFKANIDWKRVGAIYEGLYKELEERTF